MVVISIFLSNMIASQQYISFQATKYCKTRSIELVRILLKIHKSQTLVDKNAFIFVTHTINNPSQATSCVFPNN